MVVHPFKLVGFLSRSKCRVAVFGLWFLAWILSVPVIFSTVTTHSTIFAVEMMYRILRRLATIDFFVVARSTSKLVFCTLLLPQCYVCLWIVPSKNVTLQLHREDFTVNTDPRDPHHHLQYSRTCTASSTRTPTTRCRWRCSSAPRTPAVTGSRGKVRGQYLA